MHLRLTFDIWACLSNAQTSLDNVHRTMASDGPVSLLVSTCKHYSSLPPSQSVTDSYCDKKKTKKKQKHPIQNQCLVVSVTDSGCETLMRASLPLYTQSVATDCNRNSNSCFASGRKSFLLLQHLLHKLHATASVARCWAVKTTVVKQRTALGLSLFTSPSSDAFHN